MFRTLKNFNFIFSLQKPLSFLTRTSLNAPVFLVKISEHWSDPAKYFWFGFSGIKANWQVPVPASNFSAHFYKKIWTADPLDNRTFFFRWLSKLIHFLQRSVYYLKRLTKYQFAILKSIIFIQKIQSLPVFFKEYYFEYFDKPDIISDWSQLILILNFIYFKNFSPY